MTDFTIATGNQDKVREIKAMLEGLPLRVLSMKERGIVLEVEESGSSFCENAVLKARAIHEITGGFVMADDSGLAVDALGGEPGIYSARFMGEDADYPTKIEELWRRLKDVPREARTARFVCAIALYCPDGSLFTTEAVMEGLIHDEIAGANGFGYDPVLFLPEYGLTAAQISPEEKNRISHRGKAVVSMLDYLKKTWYSVC